MRKVILGLILVFSIGMAGCTAKSNENSSSAYDMAEEVAQYDNSTSTEGSSASVENSLQSERKIVKSGYLSLETSKFNEVINVLENMVNKYEGYIGSSSVDAGGISNTYETLRFASYEIKVPSDKLADFLEESSNLATVRNKSTSAEDITGQYYDNESRLKSLKIQEERYLEILKTAKEVKDIVEIENALTDVRYEIENLTTYFNKMNNLVDMATVNINVQEVSKETVVQSAPKTFGERIGSSFVNSLKGVKDLLINIFIFVIVAIPYVIVIGILLLFILKICRLIKRKITKNKESKNKSEK